MMWKPALRLLPLLLLPLPLLLTERVAELSSAHRLFLGTLPWLVGLIVIMLSLGFKQSRALLTTLHLGAVAGLFEVTSSAPLDNPASYILLIALGLCWPLMLGWLTLLPERRTLSRAGLLRIAILLAPYAALALLWHYHPMQLVHLLPLLPLPFIDQLYAQLTISPFVFWWQLGGICILTTLSLLLHNRDVLLNITLSLCVLLALTDTTSAVHGQLYHLLGQLVLLTAVVRHGYDMAFVDTLTGIPGRRALEHHLISPGRGYSIAMLDIDHFKQFNDRYGHDIGDQVLRMVASQLRHVGAGGRLFRYGGEEFTIVFRRGSEDSVNKALEAVRERVAQYPMQIRGTNRPKHDDTGQALRKKGNNGEAVKVTISIGFATQANGEPAEAVIKQADQALYAAKRGGRNCTRSAQQNTPHKKRRSLSDFARNQAD
ncbi:GGDEF domain-containing protein [Marinobacterium maritimum]|uniref:diguanylate cyclase n=1 Tax=Marinobacterium maritimum TaxID=500162 RepID=A0ABP3TCJ2_9GAMM